MEYQYKCRITAWDFFRLTMRQTYRSMAGMCNLVFTVAMILLTAKFWSQSGEVLQVLMLIGCLLFPVIQPAAIYAKARRQAAAVPQDVRLTFDEKGLLVTTGGERQHLPWNRLRVTKQPGMVLVICPLSSRQVKYLKVSDKNTYISFWSVGIFMHTISLYIF